MSNSPVKTAGRYADFEELIDTEDLFVIELLSSPSRALRSRGFSDNPQVRAKINQVKAQILQNARDALKALKE